MMQVCKINACAKINIGLRVGSSGADGYHPILSLFHSVSLSDTLFFARHPADQGILVQGCFDCPGEETTIYKAIKAFLAATGIVEGLSAKVDKHIPTMAGLGGGSADAAATLVALDRLFDIGFSKSELADLGAPIGSDVPFFLFGGAALVSGRGDVVEPIAPRADFGILLLYPGFGVSTRWAYSRLDEWRAGNPAFRAEEDRSLQSVHERKRMISMFGGLPKAWDFKNSFEEILFPEFPVYATIKKCFIESGAHFVSVTGSGSCIYGVYASREEAEAAKEMLWLGLSAAHSEKTLSGMALHAIKPLETSLFLG